MLAIYEVKGTLTHAIPEDVAAAQEYLTSDDMTQYLLDPTWGEKELIGKVGHIEWKLEGDGYHWSVRVYALRELTDDELRVLGEWVSGQNSDGLGEGFEQQDFAASDCGECWACEDRSGWGNACEEPSMCSFDWETNEHKFVRIK